MAENADPGFTSFAEALVWARKRLSDVVGFSVSNREVARRLGEKTHDRLAALEKGQRPTLDDVERFVRFYGFDEQIPRVLKTSYGLTTAKPSQAESNALDLLFERNPKRFERLINQARVEIESIYDSGQIGKSYQRIRAIWPAATQSGRDFEGTVHLGLLYARILSQLGYSLKAERVLTKLGELQCIQRSPSLEVAYTFGIASYTNRSAVSGPEEAGRYTTVLQQIKSQADGQPCKDPAWLSIWNVIQRRRIAALTDALDRLRSDDFDVVADEFTQSCQAISHPNSIEQSKLIETRVVAVKGDLDRAHDEVTGEEVEEES